MATGNMHTKLTKFGGAVFELCEWTDRQTDRQTDILITMVSWLGFNGAFNTDLV